MPLRKTSDEFR